MNTNNKNLKVKRKIYTIKTLSLLLFYFFSFYGCTLFLERPSVLSVSIQDGQIVNELDNFNSIEITFSNNMNIYICEKNIHIDSYNGSVSYSWDTDKKICTLFLKDKLEWGKKYVLKITTGCENSKGVNIEKEYSVTFYTYNPSKDFAIIRTLPENQAILTDNHNQQIQIEFSDTIADQSIMDKINISPDTPYTYSYSTDKKIIYINLINDLNLSTCYIVRIKKELRSISNKTLREDYSFYFLTAQNFQPFILNNVVMKNSTTEINLDTHYQFENHGIEKDMELCFDFSAEVFEKNFTSNFTIEPAAFYTLTKERNGDLYRIRLTWINKLKSETRYKIILKKELTDIYNNHIDQQYQFFFITDGPDSLRPKILSAENNGIQFISDNEAQNIIVPLSAEQSVPQVVFTFVIKFNHSINLFQSIDKIKLTYSAGYAISTIEYKEYSYDYQENILTIKFCFDPPSASNVTTYFSFTIEGGDDGLIDTNSNALEKTITCQLSFTF